MYVLVVWLYTGGIRSVTSALLYTESIHKCLWMIVLLGMEGQYTCM